VGRALPGTRTDETVRAHEFVTGSDTVTREDVAAKFRLAKSTVWGHPSKDGWMAERYSMATR
jgi:hypothetical protein